MQTSENIAKISEAMAAVQKDMQPAAKDSKNPFFKSSYADLASVSAACKELMAKNGIAIIQSPGQCADKQMELTTRLVHKSGEWMEGVLSIPLTKFDPQAYGSALTYARRYALAAFVGVVTDDDDGNAASRPNDGAVANDTPKNQKLNGTYKSKTALWAAIKAFDHELRGCGDSGMLEGLLAMEETKDLIAQVKQDASSLWDGIGNNLPPEFEPLEQTIKKLRTELENIDEYNKDAA